MGRPACSNPQHVERRADGRCVTCLKAGRKRYYLKDPAAYRAQVYDWNRRNPEVRAAIARRRRYGFEPPRPCPELCELCHTRKARCLYHDHKTGLFRGWLCYRCNNALGALGDCVDGLYNAIAYLLSP